MLPDNQKVLIAADHAGYELKQYLVEKLTEQGYILVDFGTNAPDSVDYPDYAHKVAQAVLHEEAGIAILVCGSGIGMSIVANRYKGIRAALCHSEELAYLARTHNHANILCLAARFTSPTDALQI
ncbi:MAG: RpiB/LacA/LacB family sugar-phosphate isomerase, partial [Chitinophagia bacterium]|nr:RpiB/LacA/LacB family sugar-phosphate isomerase [Chitinophagia bacterium]